MMHRGDGMTGGAQIQMNRLRRGLLGAGVDARVLCREASSEQAVVMPYRPRVEGLLHGMTSRLGLNDVHLVSSNRVRSLPEVRDADVIDLHCLHSGTFSYRALPGLCAAKPVVFTIHDMWPFTGHCHASLECDRWKSGCGSCPHLDVEPVVRRDATALEWRWKRQAYGKSRFTAVVPSRWMAERMGESLLAEFPRRVIPHGIDLEVFKPRGKERSREALGLPAKGKVILCAIDNSARPLKGMALLRDALEQLPEETKRESTLLFFGRASNAELGGLRIPVVNLGHLAHDPLKVLAYSAADVLVHPTRAESFGLVALESIACGTPVVAFGVGGIPELVRPGETGMLAQPENAAELAMRVAEVLGGDGRRMAMAARCREIAEAEYDVSRQVSDYLDLYQEMQSEVGGLNG
ncbi:MAG: glycosyltransferase [Verrucomicrobiales bacterium]